MIARHIPMRKLNKSHFSSLVDYLLDPQDKAHRVGQVLVTNCHQVDPRDAMIEVEARQQCNTRAKPDKTFHLVLSFQEGEQIDNERLAQIEADLCAGLGYGEHQWLSVVHHDTDNLHVHIAINKIHPKRHNLHEPYYSYHKLAELCVEAEEKYDLAKDNHAFSQERTPDRARKFEVHQNSESLQTWIQRECVEKLMESTSWDAFHGVLAEQGFQLKARGNGFLFASGDNITVKTSAVTRSLSKPGLESKLGSFRQACLSFASNTVKTQI